MNQKKTEIDTRRRSFLRGSVAAGAGVAITSAGTASAAEPVITNEQEKPVKEGYQLSAHVLKYYQTISG